MKKLFIMLTFLVGADNLLAANTMSTQLQNILDIVKKLKNGSSVMTGPSTSLASAKSSMASLAKSAMVSPIAADSAVATPISVAPATPTLPTSTAPIAPSKTAAPPATTTSVTTAAASKTAATTTVAQGAAPVSSTTTTPALTVTPFVLNSDPKTPDIVQLGTFSPATFAPAVTTSAQLQGLTPITCQGGLVYLNVGVTDGQGHYVGFNFNAQLFNTLQMQNLLIAGMYIVVNKVKFGYYPTLEVLLTDKNSVIYAQGVFNLPLNVNPTTYAVGFNTLQSNAFNGTTSQGVNNTPIGTPLYYKQASYTSPTSFWAQELDPAQYGPDLGNVDIANITPISQAKFFTYGTFNVGTAPFAAQTTQPSAASVYNLQPYTCAANLQILNVGIFDGVNSYVDFQFGPDVFASAQMKNLCSLGLFINLELVPAQAATQASFNVYLTDALGTVYAQASSPAGAINPNATPVYYNVGFNNNLPSFIPVASVPLNAVVWYQNGSVAVAKPSLNPAIKSPVVSTTVATKAAPVTTAPVVTPVVNAEPTPPSPSINSEAEGYASGYGEF